MSDCRKTCAARRNENAECVCAELDEMTAEYMTLLNRRHRTGLEEADLLRLRSVLGSPTVTWTGGRFVMAVSS